MNEIIRIRKELDVTQIKVAEHLKKKQYEYNRMEKSGCSIEIKNRIITFLMMECYNLPTSRKSLGISQKRLASLLGIQYTHLSTYEKLGKEIKGLKPALEKEHKRRMMLKDILAKMLE